MRHGRMRWEAVRVRARVLSPDRASCAQGKRENRDVCIHIHTFSFTFTREPAEGGGGAPHAGQSRSWCTCMFSE